MKCFNWKEEESISLGLILRPVAEIAVKDTEGSWKYLTAYVDSGADITFFPRSFGELLGIKIEKGNFAEFGGISGKIQAYIHKIMIKIGDDELKVRAAFCKDPHARVPNLLGRLDLFNYFEIHFKNIEKKTCFIRTKR